MIKVEFMGPIGKGTMSLDVSGLQELKEVLQQDKGLKGWLEICAVAINDEIVCSLEYPLEDGDKVTLLPPVCGG